MTSLVGPRPLLTFSARPTDPFVRFVTIDYAASAVHKVAMQSLIPFSKINWGPDDARGDTELLRYFVPLPGIDDILCGKIRYVLGRKGTGKTAVCEYLRQKTQDDHTAFHRNVSLRNFPLGLLRSLEDRRMAEKAKYVPVWRYVLLMELCQMVLENQALELDPIRKDVEEFITSNFGDRLATVDKLTILHEKGLKLSIGKWGVAFEAGGKSSVSATGEIHYQIACERIEKLLKQVVPSFRYFLFIDDLDEGYKAGDPNIRLILLALIRAVEDFAHTFQGSSVQLRPVLALRSDIWNGLNDNDLNKCDDYTMRLRWNQSGDDGVMSLRRVINARITASLNIPESTKDWWISFAQETDSTIPGDTHSLWKHMLVKTYDRPRDILKFLKICTKIRNPDRLLYKDVEASERAYSEWLYDELKNEGYAHIPVWVQVLDCVSRLGKIYIDDPRELIAVFQADPKVEDWMRNSRTLPEELLSSLFDFGVIGNVHRATGYFYFKHKNEDARYDISAKTVVQFGLIKKLSLRNV